ncbi:hypothetical protein [Halioxenophilus sp. WMMB6]|uniref:hypothetical protein n=1 Tax=Halioxenophilus sp. WMMB6 TaxID=3073815 RepID=UPI00295E6355|nr:hypothetical protein [Halioxenophilus sp. WMMB6]
MYLRFWPLAGLAVILASCSTPPGKAEPSVDETLASATGISREDRVARAPSRSVPDFEGTVATPKPLPPLPMPAHPYQNNNGYAGAHADSYNSGTIPAAGPLGKDLQVNAYRVEQHPAYCSVQHFDAKGRVITVCVGRKTATKLLLLEPETMGLLDEYELPPMAGFYFRMDQQGRVVIPVGDMSMQTFEIIENSDGPKWHLVRRQDISSAVPAEHKGPMTFPLDLVADWQGNWWFSILRPAAVGYITPEGEVHSHLFEGEVIANGLAANPEGVHFVTDHNLYSMKVGAEEPEVTLRMPYEVGEDASKESFGSGSGTTPVIFGDNLIAFGDNADPRPNVLVYRLGDVPEEQRLVCKVPVFKPGRSVLENSFIGYGNSLVIENNKGFKMVGSSADAETGFVRIDVRDDLSGCDTVWENYDVRAGTGAKLSLGNGLIYVHELLLGTDDDWYITTIDFETGKTVWRHHLGTGVDWDNALLTMSISPKGVITSGMFTGVLGAQDSP